MTTSTIDPTVPVFGALLESTPVRMNFQAAYSDINALWSVVNNPVPAVNVAYDKTIVNLLTSTNVQSAIDELASDLLTPQGANTFYAGPSTGANATPTYRVILGADLPSPNPGSRGGVNSYAAVSNQFINSIGTNGIATSAQPNVLNLAGFPGGTTTYLRADGSFAAVAGSGTVTSASVVTANGFAGTVATATTTPAITLTTSVTGILSGNGTAISAATTTGSGNVVLATSPTIATPTLSSPTMTTPTLGVASATTVNKVTITAPATGSTLTIADGATLTASATASVSGTNTGDQTITLTGPVTGSGTGSFATTVGTNVITTNNISQFAGLTIPGRSPNGTGNLGSITAVAASGSVMRESGSTIGWGTIATAGIGANQVTNAVMAQMAANTIKGNNTGVTANALDLTATQATAMLNVFTSALNGLVPLSGGGTTNFLRADGTFAAPAGGTGVLKGVQGITASGTYTPTSGATTALVFITGGGGGGTGGNTSTSNGGGGAGLTAIYYMSSVSSQTVTIGAAGTAGAAANGLGGPGGQSAFGTVTANGGLGAAATGGVGGVGASTSSGATLAINGGGGAGGPISGNGTGIGGASFWGGGGNGVVGVAGAAGMAYGSGGSGGAGAGNTGGAGKAGVVLVLEFA